MEKTIAAVSTAPAPGGIGIVRISGEEALAVADQVFRGVSGKKLSQMRGYTAQLGGAFTPAGERLDDVVALVYRSPKSYTGEDVVELSCHGGLYVTKRLLQLVLDAVTVCVEDALTALSALTGEHVSEEIVDRVFEEFCVGK